MVFSFNQRMVIIHALLAVAALLPFGVSGVFALGAAAIGVTAILMTNPPKTFDKAERAAYNRDAAKAWGIFALCWFYLTVFGVHVAFATSFPAFAVMIVCSGIMYGLGIMNNKHHNNMADRWGNQ